MKTVVTFRSKLTAQKLEKLGLGQTRLASGPWPQPALLTDAQTAKALNAAGFSDASRLAAGRALAAIRGAGRGASRPSRSAKRPATRSRK